MSIDSGGNAVNVPRKAVKAKLSRLRAKIDSLKMRKSVYAVAALFCRTDLRRQDPAVNETA
ncbi:MAG: hypothetical protein ACAH22_14310, partial [Tardiphaga sp.]